MILLAAVVFCPASNADEPSRAAVLHFPEPVGLEQLWFYRNQAGAGRNAPGVAFCVGTDPEDCEGERRLIVAEESLFSAEGLRELLGRGPKSGDRRMLYKGTAPQRESAFTRIDLDGDEIDEVLLTGTGGAGGTSLLSVFAVQPGRVRLLFDDASRFGFWIFDRDGQGKYTIANAGFDWTAGADDLMQPERYKLYDWGRERFDISNTVSPAEFERMIGNLVERNGAPLPARPGGPHVRVFDSSREVATMNPSAADAVPERVATDETESRTLVPADAVFGEAARGWKLLTEPHDNWGDRKAVIVSPSGRRFAAPEVSSMPLPSQENVLNAYRPRVQVLDVPSLKAEFLLIYTCPAASAPTGLSLFLLRDGEIAGKAAVNVLHHFEWIPIPSSAGIVPELFVDLDGDGRPELKENDVGKFGGRITYHQFDGTTFRPRWCDHYEQAPPESDALIVWTRREEVPPGAVTSPATRTSPKAR
ncbi:MAG: hypothetical protein WD069_16335 [Planctomycetales bacterium]